MLNNQKLIIDHFALDLEASYRQNYGTLKPELGTVIAWASRLALQNIGNSDMLYHNVEHTMLVTAVGQEILTGKHLSEGGVRPGDWLNFTMALLHHDIGYVRGVCRRDQGSKVATGEGENTVELPVGATDAALTPYHVSRSKLFVRERFAASLLPDLDPVAIESFIEMTRFPSPNTPEYKPTATYAGLVRAADFIGQLGDPNYIRKLPALFFEYEQLGLNVKMGYKNPDDLRRNYATFYWKVVSPFIQDAIRYLQVTLEGKQWIANLLSHVMAVEHEAS
jgi:hypothetical protein